MRVGSALGVVLAPVAFAALAACGRHEAAPRGEPAPPASVIGIGVALGACEDVDACARECDAGSAERCRRLASTYEVGRGAEKDEARATALYARACDMNDAPACVFAGRMHEFAHGVPKDDAAAVALYRRACDMGWTAGCYNLAIMLDHGRGVAPDPARARALYDVACKAGAKAACDRAKEMRVP